MNEGMRQIGGLGMSIKNVLAETAFEYEVDGGIDESTRAAIRGVAFRTLRMKLDSYENAIQCARFH
jgi:hypothetical protein